MTDSALFESSLVAAVQRPWSIATYQQALNVLSDEAFDALLNAADELIGIQRALAHDGQSVLTELFRDVSPNGVMRWQHYPTDDSADPETGAMFYYHAHEAGERPCEEHGHFHLFIRSPSGEGFSHVVACSMSADGRLRSLFTTNRWVTDETWCPAPALCAAYPSDFVIERARPSWLVVRWLMAVVAIFSSCIDALLKARDAAVHACQSDEATAWEDRQMQVLSEMPVDLLAALTAIQQEGVRRYSA